MAFTHSWSPTVPADSEDIDLGAGRIRDFKLDIRERVAVDHSFAGDANDGLHLHVELIPQGGAPGPVNGTDGVVYTQVIAGVTELFYRDSAGNVLQFTSSGGLAPSTVQGNINVTGTLAVGSNSVITGTLEVGGLLTADNGLSINGAVTSDANITTTADVHANSVFAGGDVDATGDVNAGANLSVTGTAFANKFEATGGANNQFYMEWFGGTVPLIAFDNNCYLMFDRVARKFFFFVDGIAVANFP
jgi:cytoskeletal protein CcmA (bactofilin family)